MNRLIRQAVGIALPVAPENFQELRGTAERVYGDSIPLESSSLVADDCSNPVDDLLSFIKYAMRQKTF
jgi:hypothetical protein